MKNRSAFLCSLFAVMCFDGSDEDLPEGGTPNPEMEADAPEDEATTEIHATEHDAPAVQAEPGMGVTEQSADDDTR